MGILYYEGVVVDYLRADRALFVNVECCIQLNQASNPDNSGPHWYCDAVACDFRNRTVFLCEISYEARLTKLVERLSAWNENWKQLCAGLRRDSFTPENWPIRPWLFVPELLIPTLLKRIDGIGPGTTLAFTPRITTLEMVQPWRYKSWNRMGEADKPSTIPEAMRV